MNKGVKITLFVLMFVLIALVVFKATRPLDKNSEDMDRRFSETFLKEKLEEFKIACSSYPQELKALLKSNAPTCFQSQAIESIPYADKFSNIYYELSDGVYKLEFSLEE